MAFFMSSLNADCIERRGRGGFAEVAEKGKENFWLFFNERSNLGIFPSPFCALCEAFAPSAFKGFLLI